MAGDAGVLLSVASCLFAAPSKNSRTIFLTRLTSSQCNPFSALGTTLLILELEIPSEQMSTPYPGLKDNR